MSTPVVLITGALTGIGRAAALAFAREGSRLVVSGRHEEAGQALAIELRALGAETEFVRVDVRHEDDMRELVDRTIARFGRLDAAVNNAGTEGHPGPVTEQTADSYASTFDTNVLGTLQRACESFPFSPAFCIELLARRERLCSFACGTGCEGAMSEPGCLFGELPEQVADGQPEAEPAPPRLRQPQREQIELRVVDLDGLLPLDHPARAVWAFVERLDLSAVLAAIKAREGEPGHPPANPQIPMALWLYATIDAVGSGRALARLCQRHVAYQWICGGVSMNHHTLADFRVAHAALLGPGTKAWRQRMSSAEGKAVYRHRAKAECVNADLRNRGLQRLMLRGRAKVRAVLLWFAVAHNLMRAMALRAAAARAAALG